MVLQVRHLTLKLKIGNSVYPVVRDLNFSLEKGKTLALVGESGCGKSLTAQALLRILPEPPALPPEGEVVFNHQNILKLSNKQMRRLRGKNLAMIFQDPMSALNPVYTIGAQLMEVVHTHLRLEGEKAIGHVMKALEDVHLPNPYEIMKRYPHQLSGGMLQRAMIAMALICSPDILIADEPTTALDVTIQGQILHLLKELQEKKGMATLLITHDMHVVEKMADAVIVMYAGNHVETAETKALFDSPSHPYTQALFAARLDPKMRKQKLNALSGHVPRITQLPTGCPFHPRCQHAMAICKEQTPAHFHMQQPGHTAKCWIYEKAP